jgi:hypothetical protein
MAEAQAREEEEAPRTAGGLGATIVNNMPTFGYSLLATGSFGVINHYRGSPGIGGVTLFVTGAILAFAVGEALSTRLYRHHVGEEPERVLALGTTFSFVSVGASVVVAGLVGKYLHAEIAWGAGGCAASATYILLSGLEMTVAERIEARQDAR